MKLKMVGMPKINVLKINNFKLVIDIYVAHLQGIESERESMKLQGKDQYFHSASLPNSCVLNNERQLSGPVISFLANTKPMLQIIYTTLPLHVFFFFFQSS